MLTTEQLEARKAGIGGSDAAVLLGLSPWKTEVELYYEKLGEWEPEDISDKPVVHFGNILEPVVADEYAERNGVKVEKRNQMMQSKKYPHMLANIDRKVVGMKRGLECKTADANTKRNWGEQGTDNVPDYYRIQCEHYMIVTEWPEWDLAALIGGNDYRDYHIEQDAELSEMMIEREAKFWERVEKRLVPDIDFAHPGTGDLLKRLYPGTNGETIELDENMAHWHYTMEEAKKLEKTYHDVVEGCKARILAAMGENAVGIIPGANYQYKRSEVKKKEFTVAATSYIQMRGSNYNPK